MSMENINKIIGDSYEVKEKIIQGILSNVYRGIDKGKGSPVLINVINKETCSCRVEDILRFKEHIKKIKQFSHAHILQATDLLVYSGVGEEGNLLYFVTKYYEIETLEQLIGEEKRFDIQEVIEIIYQMASGLEYAHQRNIFHLDLNPANIAVDNKQTAKILNFGLTCLLDYTLIKDTRKLIEILSYTSPEQAGVLKTMPDERSDLYSLGIILYRLLTRQLPFYAETSEELLHQHISKIPISPRKINPQIPEVLEEIVLKLLEKEPQQRYQTARGLIKDLERVKSGEKSFIVGKDDFLGKLSYRTRLIGREEQLKILKDSFQKTVEGEGNILLVAGEAGRGKSRLIDEFSSFLLQRDVIFLSGNCFSQKNKTPYQVLRDILNDYIDKIERLEFTKKAEHIRRIKEVLGELGEIILRINPSIQTLIGKQPSVVELDSARENRRFLMVASNFFLNLSTKDMPVVIYLDDLQWADEGTLSILEEISTQIKNFPLFLIGGYRDNEVTEEHTLSRIKKEAKEKEYPLEEIKLGPFDHNFLNKLISHLLLEDEERMVKLSKYILDKSGGNPFFSIEIVRQIVEQKGLVYNDEKRLWNIDWERIQRISIPTNIVDIVLRRIETLDKGQVNLLSYSSCIGREFELNLLFHLIELSQDEIINFIDGSITLQLLERSNERGSLLFVHDRIREAFYNKMTDKERINHHLKIGEIIEERNKGKEEDVIFELAYHYIEAKEKEKALRYVIPAAKKAKESYANGEAIKYYEYAIKDMEERREKESEKWIEINEGLAEVYLTVGKNDEAIKILDVLLPLKKSNLEKARTYKKIGIGYFKKGDFIKCEDNLGKGLKLLGMNMPKGNIIISILKELIIHLLHSLNKNRYIKKTRKNVTEEKREIAQIFFPLNWMYVLININKFLWSVLKTLNFSESHIGRSKELGTGISGYASILMAIPLFKLSEKNHKRALKLRNELNDEYGVAQCLQLLGFCYSWWGKHQKSIETLHQSREKFEKLGDIWELGMVYKVLGKGYRRIPDYQRSIDNYNKYLKISYKINDKSGISASNINISYSYIETGAFENAEKSLKESLNVSKDMDDKLNYCEANAVFGYLEIERKNYDEAIKYLEDAIQTDKNNSLLKEFTVVVYYNIIQAYIEKFKVQSKNISKKEKIDQIKKIKTLYKEALSQTKSWPNHYFLSIRAGAKYYALINKKNKAKEYFLRSIKLAKQMDRKLEIAKSYYEYGIFLESIKKEYEAKQKWQEAYDIFKEIGANVYVERTANLLGIVVKGELNLQERFLQERRLRTLITVSHFLSSILDLDELLEKIVDSSLKISGAERGFLLIYNPQKELEIKIIKGLEKEITVIPEIDYKRYKLSPKVIQLAEEKQQSLLVNPTNNAQILDDEDIRAYRIKSIIITPLKVREEILGYLYLDNCLVEEAFSEDDLELVDSLGIQATISLQNAFLVKEMIEKQRMEEEMQLGRQIQINLLPQKIPQIEGLKVIGFMEPAKEIGGDYYDFIKVAKSPGHHDTSEPEKLEESEQPVTGALETGVLSRLGIVIGDVSGKGVSAGLIMATAKATLKGLSQQEMSPKKMLAQANTILYEYTKGEKFITMLYMQWDAQHKKLNYSSAGHEHILVYREQKTENREQKTDEKKQENKAFDSTPASNVEVIKSGGFMLGMMPEIENMLEDKELSLNSGDKVVLYTDGVTEARNNTEEQFSLERLTEVVGKYGEKPVEELIECIKDEIYKFIGNREQYDDITLVGMEVE